MFLLDVVMLTLPTASVSITVNFDVFPFSRYVSVILVVKAGMEFKLLKLFVP